MLAEGHMLRPIARPDTRPLVLSQAERLFTQMLGPHAVFRDGQSEAIRAVVEDRADAGRAADGLGEEPRLLHRGATAAGWRLRPDATYQSAPRADAQPDRDGRTKRDPRTEHQQHQQAPLED